ncbi:MAG TPA: formyl-CoA transferase [Dehalococcoidia bacterium]|jgi:formyl-CoA transferase|nr:formyl-CoA transferase [SAR202 cluster bacterium]HAC18557.1 formyl-CoA transferase [Dehalococcoidia bacterium]HBJ33038.1 formyl-CoA transferase [Dehalococcoidia bacterium]HIA15921.1 formyl-CoA transferase [Dehalococcoidia bacterium]HIM91628.1 formyl-CoA transferase [Dehalococcoidia bacterium]|tara:strand:+ start:3955 stop:5133 length:1179 start_codon:yes stop_codon:yes gene_type:complete
MDKALEGVKILDLSRVQAGPSCTQLLGFLGADVIKVEDTGGGDRTRWEMAHNEHDSVYFTIFNNNKRAITLNLKDDRGRAMLADLVKWADIVLENYSKGVMERLGIGYEWLKSLKPDIIYASIKGFGNWGDWSEFKSFETAAQATGGLMSANGSPDGPPKGVSIGAGDSGTGLHMAIAVLAALRQRDKSGEGQMVEVSMQDGITNLMRISLIKPLSVGEVNTAWGRVPNVFRCAPGGDDDYVMIHTRGDLWITALAVMGKEAMFEDERYMTDELRGERADEVREIIEEWTMQRTKYEAFEALAAAGVWCGAVLTPVEVINNEHLKQREMIVTVKDDYRGDYRMIGSPVKMEKSPVTVTQAPRYSEHTDEILKSMLGVSEDELVELRSDGVII